MTFPFNISKNLAQSSLASGYTAGNTTITVQTGDGSKFDSAPFVVAVDSPPQFFLKVTGKSGDTLTVDTTGYDGSTAVSVSAATPITEVITAGVLQALLEAASPVLGTAIFDASAGSIASATYAGIVSGVTYTTTGKYAVAFSSNVSDYLVHIQLSNDSGTFVGIGYVVYNSITSSGFSMGTIQLNGGGFTARDFPHVFVSVVKL